MSLAVMKIKEQKKLENIQLLTLVPSGVHLFSVWEKYLPELLRLEVDGFEVRKIKKQRREEEEEERRGKEKVKRNRKE